MKANTAIGDIMTTDIVSAQPDEPILKIRDRIKDNRIHHVPVVEDNRVVGMISLNDIHRLEHHFTIFNNPEAEASNTQLFSTMLAKEIMTTPVITLKATDTVKKAVEIFLDNKFHAIPVLNEQNQIVGMLTTFDVIRHSLDK